MADFTHLHVHTQYSLLDGVNSIPKLLEKVSGDGMEAVAMTDHGVMNGFQEFWALSKDFNVKPILGCEVYVAPGDRRVRKEIDGIKYYHLLMLAMNKTGWQNLVKLVSRGHSEGYYYNPRVDRELLKKYSEGLIVTSACLASPIARNINYGRLEEAEDWVRFFKETFPGRFYLELQRNGFDGKDEYDPKYEQQYGPKWAETIRAQIKVNNKLREYAAKYDLPLVATTDAHFLNAEDKDVQKVLFCIMDGVTLDDPKAREGYEGTYVTTQEEMLLKFADDRTPLDNTMRIAEQVEEFDIMHDRVQPAFWNLPAGKTAQQELRDQTYEGAKWRYGEVTPELRERIDYELEIIHNKGYDDYFLVVGDLLQWSAENGIQTGTRGSVTGSVVAYCLDIVKIDPIKWELYFERFLNPERPTPPDIDMDIQDSRRDELVQYSRDKYGSNSVAAIATFGRFQTKAAIRDVSRVMGIDLGLADKLSKMVGVKFGKVFSIDKQMDEDEEFKSLIENDPELMRMADIVRKITGLARNLSIHAAGYLITPKPIVNYTPVQKAARGDEMITQLEFGPLEETGLMKFDFLGLRTLTILGNAVRLVNERHNMSMTLEDIPDDDKKTFDLFATGETMGVFQFESPPMRRYLQELQPTTQEDICFMAAAYRPGPMQYIPDYISIKHGRKEAEYIIPEIKPIVETTNGFAIYQEQVIKIAVELAGYSMGHADLLRRAMGKKKMKVMKKEEPIFKEGIKKLGYGQDIADQIWEYLLPFADYGFNKAHAAAYAVLAYKCAYFKAHYPLEFMTALMHSDLENTERITIDIQEAKHLGFQVLAPDVNSSGVFFEASGDDTIIFGLGAVKNVGTHMCEAIVKAREEKGKFHNLNDLIQKVGTDNISKKALECLIKVGATDSFGPRNSLLAILPSVFDQIAKQQKMSAVGQVGMFGLTGAITGASEIIVPATPLPRMPELEDRQLIQWEKELIGIFLSRHPLDKYQWASLLSDFTAPERVAAQKDGNRVKVLASINEIKVIRTKASNEKMAFLNLDLGVTTIEAVLFPSSYATLEESLDEAVPLIVSGSVSHRNDEPSILINNISSADRLRPPEKITIDICSVRNEIELERIRKCFTEEGELTVEIKYGEKFSPKRITRKSGLTPDCLQVLQKYIVKK